MAKTATMFTAHQYAWNRCLIYMWLKIQLPGKAGGWQTLRLLQVPLRYKQRRVDCKKQQLDELNLDEFPLLKIGQRK